MIKHPTQHHGQRRTDIAAHVTIMNMKYYHYQFSYKERCLKLSKLLFVFILASFLGLQQHNASYEASAPRQAGGAASNVKLTVQRKQSTSAHVGFPQHYSTVKGNLYEFTAIFVPVLCSSSLKT